MEDHMRKPTTKKLQPIKTPTPEIEDHGTVRYGNGSITAEFPPLKRPGPEIEDRGTVRYGNGSITAEFPL
jgi:hypothetical protein